MERFIVGTGLQYYQTGVSNLNEINNRVAFTWQNANTIKMMMNAKGQLRIGRTLTIPGTLPNNRVEITASLTDPYFGSANGSSGLRFTNLTSAKPVVANGGLTGVNYQKALSVDANGDVVLIPSGVPTANQGLIVTGNNVQLGDVCATPAIMSGNRAINMSNGNFVWGNGRVGFGTAFCGPLNNRVVIQGLGANQSGLRFNNLTSASPTQPNGAQGVLSVNALGDVVLVDEVSPTGANGIVINPANGNIQLGSNCAATNPQGKSLQGLQNTRYLHLNGNNFIFGDGGRVGIGMPPFPNSNACAVGNKLEVDNGAANPNTSGVRLTRLTSLSPPLANGTNGLNNTKVLTVDQFGDIVLTNAPLGGGNALGNLCTAPQNPLFGNYEIPLNNFEFNFSGDNTNVNKVNVGSPCGTPTFGKFNVSTAFQTDPTQNRSFSIYGSNTYNGNLLNTGVYGEAISTTAFFERGVSGFASAFRDARGVYGEAGTVSNGAGWGGYFLSTTANNPNNFGATGVAGNATFRNEGVIGTGLGGQICHGGNFAAFGGSNVNVGVSGKAFPTNLTYAPTYPSGINVGVYGQVNQFPGTGVPVDFAGFFDGDVWFNGGNSGTGLAVISDAQFKNNVDTITNPLSILKQLKPKKYYLDTTNVYGIHFSGKKQYGFIAQDVQTVLPELVNNKVKPAMVDTLGAVVTPSVAFKDLNYNAFFALLTAGMQKQQSQIEKQDSIITLLTTQLAALTQSVSSCCSNTQARSTGIVGNNAAALNQLNVELNDKDVITLSQNVPNPYAEQTTITYNVPEQYGFAQIIFKTVEGKIIKAVDITKKGKGQLNVFASDLSQGLYMYTLIVDGKVIDTKKMVKQ
ncbi:MAG: tail fiber domain-containing protein [Bacteroidetes bacterium]|nr:tail fiber domain-containing protein [Bacteroidota bacterium]